VVDGGLREPAKICFYTSDYGYGHAARDIAIARRILKELNAKLFIKTSGPHRFMEQSLPGAKVIRAKNDIGPVFVEGGTHVNRDGTAELLEGWISSWDDHIKAEKDFCRTHKIDLILSDIPPQPLMVADELDLPSLGVSNFTWHYIFFSLLGETEATDRLKEAYSLGDLALVLPFHEEMAPFRRRKPISLVSREINVAREHLRRRYNIAEDELLVYLGIGRSVDSALLKGLRMDAPGLRFLTSTHVDLPLIDHIKIPPEETETQNYIAMCDLVVSKAGYSTVSEAVRAEVPMLLFRRDGYEEDSLIVEQVESLGIGKEISEASMLRGEWDINGLEGFRERFFSLERRLKDDGAPEVVEVIKEFL
jgi:hypothetical protein